MVWVQSRVALALVVWYKILHKHRYQLCLGMCTVPGLRDDAVQLGLGNRDIFTEPHWRKEVKGLEPYWRREVKGLEPH